MTAYPNDMMGMNGMSKIQRRIQILFYSALISIMSGLNSIRSKVEPRISHDVQPSIEPVISEPGEGDKVELMTKPGFWTRTTQALTAFIIWTILGFSAGFLLGIIRLR